MAPASTRLTPQAERAINSALTTLREVGAIGGEGEQLTPLGHHLAQVGMCEGGGHLEGVRGGK